MVVYCIMGSKSNLVEICKSKEIAEKHLEMECYKIMDGIENYYIQKRYVWED